MFILPRGKSRSVCSFVGTKQPQLDRLLNTALVFHQSDDKLKKESSRDEEDNEDEGSTPKAEEYDPMEAEDADDDDDDGKATSTIAASPERVAVSPGQ